MISQVSVPRQGLFLLETVCKIAVVNMTKPEYVYSLCSDISQVVVHFLWLRLKNDILFECDSSMSCSELLFLIFLLDIFAYNYYRQNLYLTFHAVCTRVTEI